MILLIFPSGFLLLFLVVFGVMKELLLRSRRLSFWLISRLLWLYIELHLCLKSPTHCRCLHFVIIERSYILWGVKRTHEVKLHFFLDLSCWNWLDVLCHSIWHNRDLFLLDTHWRLLVFPKWSYFLLRSSGPNMMRTWWFNRSILQSALNTWPHTLWLTTLSCFSLSLLSWLLPI